MRALEQTLLTHQLTDLELAKKAWAITPDGEHLRKYITNYDWCISMIVTNIASVPRPYIKQILEHLPTLRVAILNGHRDLPLDLSDHLLDLLIDPANESIINGFDNKDEVLAWFCADHCVLYMDEANREEKQARKFRRLLREWTGQTISEDTEPVPAFVIPLLHGDTCWELFGHHVIGDNLDEDIEESSVCVREIAKLGLPLTFREKKHPQEAIPDMPDNLL